MINPIAIANYNAASAVFAGWFREGLISGDEYHDLDTMIATKYGLSSCSIYRRNSLINNGVGANMADEGRLFCDQNHSRNHPDTHSSPDPNQGGGLRPCLGR